MVAIQSSSHRDHHQVLEIKVRRNIIPVLNTERRLHELQLSCHLSLTAFSHFVEINYWCPPNKLKHLKPEGKKMQKFDNIRFANKYLNYFRMECICNINWLILMIWLNKRQRLGICIKLILVDIFFLYKQSQSDTQDPLTPCWVSLWDHNVKYEKSSANFTHEHKICGTF